MRESVSCIEGIGVGVQELMFSCNCRSRKQKVLDVKA